MFSCAKVKIQYRVPTVKQTGVVRFFWFSKLPRLLRIHPFANEGELSDKLSENSPSQVKGCRASARRGSAAKAHNSRNKQIKKVRDDQKNQEDTDIFSIVIFSGKQL